MEKHLTWFDTFEIARLLHQRNPRIDLTNLSLDDVLNYTIGLPEFNDDIDNATDQFLLDIFCEWLEEDLSNE